MADELLKRVMPNNVEAEQSVIGAMLMDRDAITIASEILTVDDFCLLYTSPSPRDS